MTRREQIKVDELLRRMDELGIQMNEAKMAMTNYVKEDKEWKSRFENKIRPIVKERDDRIILQNAGKYIWKGLVAFVIFLASVGAVVHYGPEMLKTFFRVK